MTDDVSGANVVEAVTKWLGGHGYPQEMTVAMGFRRRRFLVEQSQYYRDPEDTEQWREIDIVATQTDWESRTLPSCARPGVIVQVGFIAECKRSRYPWIVFTHRTRAYRHRPCQLRAYNSQSVKAVLALEKRQSIPALPLFDPLSGPVGYGLTAMKEKGKDAAYEALFQAAKASCALASDAYGLPDKLPWFRLFFPMVVLDGVLTHAWLRDDGSLGVEETDRASVIIRYPGIRHAQLCVEIVTVSGLDRFMQQADEAAGLIAGLCLSDLVDEIRGSEAR